MDKPTRTLIQNATQTARRLLEQEFGRQLEGDYNILPNGAVLPEPGAHLDARGRLFREKLVAAITHHRAAGMTEQEARDALLREAAFTALNRFVALKMLEARGVVQECVSKGEQSAGFREFGMPAPGLIGLPDKGYRIYLESLFDEIGREVRVLFDRRDVAGQLWPRRQALNDLLETLNDPALVDVWSESETIGWVYQYFNGEDERREMRKSAAPRNSRELAVRNQFFTPSYVVAFLADNTLGRIWYEMRQGHTRLADQCHYLLRRPNEVFLAESALALQPSVPAVGEGEPGNKPIYVPYRKTKDPRQIQILDPAVGSGHYLLYCLDLLLTIYEEAWDDCPDLLADLRAAYAAKSDFLKHVPAMILRHNLHGVDIDPRAAQIAELALWMRAQRAYADAGIRGAERPPIRKTNIVVAEPMPGDRALLAEFLAGVDDRLHDLVTRIWQKMQLAGEAGTLLKIEQEIDVALRAARSASLVDALPVKITTFAPGQQPEQAIFAFASDEERQFWDDAEEQLLDSLRSYAQRASGADGTRRWLFADNAEQGFAFIDACRRRYDVVLMNPPFGAASMGWKAAFERAYPRTKNDLYAAFVERGLELLRDDGLLGAITSRTGFFTRYYKNWRELILHEARPILVMDLGKGVLDAAVETAAYCLKRTGKGQTIFFRFVKEERKQEALGKSIAVLNQGKTPDRVFQVDPGWFDQIPTRPFAYWAGRTLRRIFTDTDIPPLQTDRRNAQFGASTKSDFRFLRAWWEVSLHLAARKREATFTNDRWVPFEKGGSVATFYRDWELVIDWLQDGKVVKTFISEYRGSRGWGYYWTAALNGHSLYFKPGLTWPRRADDLSFRLLQSGCIFADKGPAVFLDDDNADELLALCALLNSMPFYALISAQMGRVSLAKSYEVGIIQQTPIPRTQPREVERLRDLALASIQQKQNRDTTNELSHFFFLPALLVVSGDNLTGRGASWTQHVTNVEARLAAHQREIDEISFDLYGIGDVDQRIIKETLREESTLGVVDDGSASSDEGDEADDDGADEEQNRSIAVSDLVIDHISYVVGGVFGRWDIRCAIGERQQPELPDPFAPLPVYSPGMLPPVTDDGQPTTDDYPLTIRDILVDDKGHTDDIVSAIREVLGVIWDNPDDIYHEAVVLLSGNGSDDLRPWLSASFFEGHIKRYSKSRRRAPIYWCLSTPSRSYAVWLYYHRFNKDTLYRVIKEYVEPKIQLEERRLANSRGDAGPNPTAGQRDAIEKQEQFVAELQTFRDDIARVAPLWNPDLNDGVIINFAPLWRLTPWPRTWQKECQQTWDALVRGDYDWSALAMRLWPERVVPKCRDDRSLAIAHGLDDVFWQERDDGKATRRDVTDAQLRALIAERTSPAIQAALAVLHAAPAEPEKPKKRAAEKVGAGSKRGRKPQNDVVQMGMDLGEE
jgi:hypothetical protein